MSSVQTLVRLGALAARLRAAGDVAGAEDVEAGLAELVKLAGEKAAADRAPAVDQDYGARRRQRRSSVYYARHGDRIKIGVSRNPWARINEMRTVAPDIELLAIEPGDTSLERVRHAQFAADHLDREWFRASPSLLTHVAAVAAATTGAATPATVATVATTGATVASVAGTVGDEAATVAATRAGACGVVGGREREREETPPSNTHPPTPRAREAPPVIPDRPPVHEPDAPPGADVGPAPISDEERAWARRLTVAANQAVASAFGLEELTNPIRWLVQVEHVAPLMRAGMPLEFAEQQVREIGTTCRDWQRRPRSLGFFRRAVLQAWEEHQAREAAAQSPLRGGVKAPADETNPFTVRRLQREAEERRRQEAVT